MCGFTIVLRSAVVREAWVPVGQEFLARLSGSALEKVFAIFADVLHIGETGRVVSAGGVQHRAAQWICVDCVRNSESPICSKSGKPSCISDASPPYKVRPVDLMHA